MKIQLMYYFHIPPHEIDKMTEEDFAFYFKGLIWIREEEAKHNKI